MKIKSGHIAVFFSLITTAILWSLLQLQLEGSLNYLFVQLNQITALLGTLLLSWSMVLATRLSIIEKIFGGLDKVYKIHKKTSIWGLGLIISHIFILAIQRLPNINKAANYFLPTHNQVFINLGAWSFWLFIFFVLITLLIKTFKIPYDIWKHTHKLTGIALILAFLHILLIPGNITSSLILNIWLLLTTGIGIASWIYFEFLYQSLSPSYIYKVAEIKKDEGVSKIKLIHQGKKMLYKPGQFAYISFIKSGLSKEIHPFSITSHPSEKELSFAVKNLGDYTKNLNQLKIGDTARIWGPHGTFAETFLNTNKDSIFIGGGIGIAPFISILKEFKKRNIKNKTLRVFYCTKYKCEACFDEEIKQFAKENSNISYLNQCSRENGHLRVNDVMEKIKDIKNTIIYICGPSKMTNSFKKAFLASGIPVQNIISEDFDLL